MSLRSSPRLAKLASNTATGLANAVLPNKKRGQSANPRSSIPGEVTGVGTGELVQKAEDDFKVPTTPSPAKKRRKVESPAPTAQPLTPTPSIVKRVSRRGGKARTASSTTTEPTDERPAAPHGTNAALQTPNGSRILPSKREASSGGAAPLVQNTPSKLPGIRPQHTSTTTATLLADAKAHLLRVDPGLAPLVNAHHCRIFSPDGLAEEIDPFSALASEIMGQQISGAAAAAVRRRFLDLFPLPAHEPADEPTFPSPTLVAATPVATLRTAGLSQRKAEYIQGLAERFRDGVLTAQMLADATDDEVMEKLVAVRGLGVWSVQMFMCFGLKRMDVFSTGDLGVQRGIAVYKGKDVGKLKGKGGKWKYLSEQEMIDAAEVFRPYRSLFMWYMWRIETAPDRGQY